MADIIVGLIVIVAVGLAVRYIYKAKKSGVKCIGCPDAGNCASKTVGGRSGCSSCSGCSCGCSVDK